MHQEIVQQVRTLKQTNTTKPATMSSVSGICPSLQTCSTPCPWTPVSEAVPPPSQLDVETALGRVRSFLKEPPAADEILFILQPFRSDQSGAWSFTWCQPWSSLGETLSWQWTEGELFCTLMPQRVSMSITWTLDQLGRVHQDGQPVLDDLVVSSSWPVTSNSTERMCVIYRSVQLQPVVKNPDAKKDGKEKDLSKLGPLRLVSYGT